LASRFWKSFNIATRLDGLVYSLLFNVDLIRHYRAEQMGVVDLLSRKSGVVVGDDVLKIS
jgi:hypothetical protein